MENKTYTVTWNPGTFGHLLCSIVEIEKYDSEQYNSLGVDSHDVGHILNNVITIHPYCVEKIQDKHNTIKPYFKNRDLKFFQWFRNQVLFLNSQRHFIEELKQQWNTVEPVCDKSYNIDMTNFLTDTTKFINALTEFFNIDSLKDKTIEFIEKKKKLNLPLYNQYLENVVDTVFCLRKKQHKDIQHLENIELAMVLCDFLHLNNKDTMRFCNSYDGKQLKSTEDILSYV